MGSISPCFLLFNMLFHQKEKLFKGDSQLLRKNKNKSSLKIYTHYLHTAKDKVDKDSEIWIQGPSPEKTVLLYNIKSYKY